jgi:hypothetical protein
MIKRVATRIPVSLLLVAAATAAALRYRPDLDAIWRALTVGLTAMLAFAGVGYLIDGWRAVLVGVLYGAGLIAGVGGRQLFGERFGALIGLALMIGFFYLASRPRFLPHRRRSERRPARTPDKAAPVPEALRLALASRPASSLIARSAGGIAYQLLRDGERLYMVRLGREAEADASRLIASGASFHPGPGNTSIAVSDLTVVRIRRGPAGRPSLRIQANALSRLFSCLEPAQERELRHIFEDAPLVVEGRRASKPSAKRYCARKATAYRKASIRLLVPGGLCAAIFTLAECPYRLFEGLNLLFAVAAFVLYCRYFRETQTMDKEARAESAAMGWGPPVAALGLRAFADFNLDQPAQMILPSAAITLAAVAVFLMITRCARPPLKRALAALACAALLFAPFASIHLNYLLDGGANRTERTANVESLRVTHGSRGSVKYTVTVGGGEDSRTLHITQSLYEALTPGDAVRLITSAGPLGIAYTDVAPAPTP